MFQEPVTFIVPTRMSGLRKKVQRIFSRLEKQVKTEEIIADKTMIHFFDRTHADWKNQWEMVDQHTGGEEFVERWWHDFFVPRFKALGRARVAQARRLSRARIRAMKKK
ncbi:MAG: hypothetical protein UW46_C0004G0023 [Candidatus Yanofskybacteria bacterium GW2011_GWF1_44_227]|uniref:Uncharacterized protein n=1 Tax=Candidatus Yanofskybacteria bacterium GW2011_GWE2_40_11 TaxID=1619033 RepID=A0A0G0QII9_9BACT|nr:MAG: hypothetical protein UT75_C0012G0012 [Candidatus Yanofskybacteria bacterium GW2011_GWE2_40_11]KKT15222.1 MAG: hypothetical protein UV97_C0010G0005 [Candidatus Yanofskybacteria bacterium GW2011_GWF2_43_596]KKT53296.1 MAG: hypothetical protein UW46_C0004G0023 [Candidatus Yanofskybacteria bacterium GW2011_GWF1_44_227]OGN35929.1 MAG: hypothetical protein A2207_02615 [Candidatus Yanofskybacteria bacterium RIFOXYA1_FULL_44_17]OGN36469.1 MAG: hypothetical protein A2241_01870 [Candidatus Yanofs